MSSAGDRIRFLRNLLGYSGKEIEELSNQNIKRTTLSAIESGRVQTLSSKLAKKLVTFFQEQNVHCTIEWLTTGTGSMPDYKKIATSKTKLADVGSRLRYIRKISNLSRLDLERLSKGRLTKSIISLVENNVNNLTPGNANIFINALKTQNIKCTAEWLLFGIGELPDYINESDEDLFNPIKESEYFKKLNPKGVIVSAQKDYIVPVIELGDIVGGIPYDFDTKPCLGVIITASGNMDIKIIKSISNDLLMLNDFTVDNHLVAKKDVLESYKIVWIRKRN